MSIQVKPVKELMDGDLMQHFVADNYRSIPSLVDGLKPSQRKVLYTCLMKQYSDIKVSQLSGAVSEYTAYHQGEASLQPTIVKMAQTFVGSNNINYLIPDGQFGSRIAGGDDAASPRYIHTKLNPIIDYIFKKEDMPILEYLYDDGKKIEPKHLLPIIPMILVNGAEGIGTGWSTKIPSYNPSDIISWIEKLITGVTPRESNLMAHWKGFRGSVTKVDDKYVTRGIFEKKGDSRLLITELPVGLWTDKFLGHLDKLMSEGSIRDYKNYSTDETVKVEIMLNKTDCLTDEQIVKTFRLESYYGTSNVNTFYGSKVITWPSLSELLSEWYKVRLNGYVLRKKYTLEKLRDDHKWQDNTIKFLELVVSKKINIFNVPLNDIETSLSKNKIEKKNDSYSYLLSMPVSSLTKEKLEHLINTNKELSTRISELEKTEPSNIWLDELKQLKKALNNAGY